MVFGKRNSQLKKVERTEEIDNIVQRLIYQILPLLFLVDKDDYNSECVNLTVYDFLTVRLLILVTPL